MVVLNKTTTVVLGLAAAVSAVPTAPPRKHLGFTVNQFSKTVPKRTINLPGMYAKALGKYGATIPGSIKVAASQGSAVTTPEQYDTEYLTPVNIGGTTLNLDFDTGSADLWVFSTSLPSNEQSGHSIYSPQGNSSKLSGYTWDISYGDGSSAGGDVYRDTVTVGGITASKQAVEAATHISTQFTQDQNNDGLLGLAFSSINTVKPQSQTTFFDTVSSQLDSPLFAVTLKHNAPGTYDFGYLDKNKYTGSIAYVDVDSSQGFWQFTSGGYAVGDGQANSQSWSAIADTGTTLMMIDSSLVSAYYKQVDSAENSQSYGGWVFPCSTDLPTFTVKIGDYNAVVPGEHINYAPVTDGSSTCFGGIQDNQGLQFSILGDVFLKSQYAVFDSQGPRLGFAPQAS